MTCSNRKTPTSVTLGINQALPVSSIIRGPNAHHTLIKILYLREIFNIIQYK